MNTRISMLFAALIFTFATTVHAQDEAPIAAEANYLNGGIGVEESDAIRLKAASYPLRITFSQGKDGRSIAGATVNITDSKGKSVFELQDAGPILYVKLPNGNYKLDAEYQGTALSKKIALAGKKGTNVYLNWKGSPDDVVTDPARDVEPSTPPTPAAE